MTEILVLNDIVHSYRRGRLFWGKADLFNAVDGVNLRLSTGETLGIVGESGSGKSTLGRIAAGIERPTRGEVLFCGSPYASIGSRAWRNQRREVQFVFQDPASAMDPRQTIHAQITEVLITHERLSHSERDDRVVEYLRLVGLGNHGGRVPQQLSGGQLQRAIIARALVLNPRLLICDEAVSALDVSVQAQILNLLLSLRERFGLSLIFITHDLGVARHLSTRIAVMHRGRLIEEAETDALFANPQQEYTRHLLSAIPAANPAAARRARQEA